jgi:hypothetical protein
MQTERTYTAGLPLAQYPQMCEFLIQLGKVRMVQGFLRLGIWLGL